MKMGSFHVNADFSIRLEDGADLSSLETFIAESFKEFIKKVTSNGFELIGTSYHSSTWNKEVKILK